MIYLFLAGSLVSFLFGGLYGYFVGSAETSMRFDKGLRAVLSKDEYEDLVKRAHDQLLQMSKK